MDGLPGHLLNKVLFKTDLRALAMLCCTNTSLQSHIHDPSFVSEYCSQIRSSLLYISSYGSTYLGCHHPHGGSRSLTTIDVCHILGCCSGLLLLFINDRLCVTNPIRKKFRFLTRRDKRKQLGLAVNQNFKNPVYLNGSLHWLRNDGSIIAFNPETEQARLIQTDFPRGLTSGTLFAPGVNSLTLVSANEKVIYVYALRNILSDPKWVLEKQIQNGVIDKNIVTWYVEAYNGKCLIMLRTCYDGVVHVYDLSASKWAVMASVPIWYDANRDFFLFTPSSSSVVGLDEILACGDRRISSLRLIMGLVDGSSSEKVE
uniref:F-box domain-containing protein n=1 Tax=Brassica oleracea TaxID=3712 RepID=A0A3P6GTH9_BRAOL|nr:unnamed protein product [Brassica oleracea]